MANLTRDSSGTTLDLRKKIFLYSEGISNIYQHLNLASTPVRLVISFEQFKIVGILKRLTNKFSQMHEHYMGRGNLEVRDTGESELTVFLFSYLRYSFKQL